MPTPLADIREMLEDHGFKKMRTWRRMALPDRWDVPLVTRKYKPIRSSRSAGGGRHDEFKLLRCRLVVESNAVSSEARLTFPDKMNQQERDFNLVVARAILDNVLHEGSENPWIWTNPYYEKLIRRFDKIKQETVGWRLRVNRPTVKLYSPTLRLAITCEIRDDQHGLFLEDLDS